jgi:hypothetical protein
MKTKNATQKMVPNARYRHKCKVSKTGVMGFKSSRHCRYVLDEERIRLDQVICNLREQQTSVLIESKETRPLTTVDPHEMYKREQETFHSTIESLASMKATWDDS